MRFTNKYKKVLEHLKVYLHSTNVAIASTIVAVSSWAHALTLWPSCQVASLGALGWASEWVNFHSEATKVVGVWCATRPLLIHNATTLNGCRTARSRRVCCPQSLATSVHSCESQILTRRLRVTERHRTAADITEVVSSVATMGHSFWEVMAMILVNGTAQRDEASRRMLAGTCTKTYWWERSLCEILYLLELLDDDTQR